MSSMLAAVRTTIRGLLRRPGYALAVAGTLALGIGAATGVFALVNAILLDTLPYPDAERLVLIRNSNAGGTWNTSVVDHRALEADGAAFESVASMRTGQTLVGTGEQAEWIDARFVTGRFFDVLGLAAARGRTFVVDDDRTGAEPVVVLGHDFAQRRYGTRDPVGETLMLDGRAHTVVGVMPEGVEDYPAMRAELWPVLQPGEPERRGPFFLGTLARVKADVPPAGVGPALEAISQRLFPIWQQGFQDATARFVAQPLHEAVTRGAASFLWLAFGAGVVVLLIAFVNTANLMLMRLAQRNQDLGVRAALGASRWRLARTVMGENVALVAVGAIAGVVLASTLLKLYAALGPAVPRIAEVTVDAGVIGFAGAIALVGAAVLAVLPLVLGAVGGSNAAARAARGVSVSHGTQRFRTGLVVLEFSLAFALLVSAGLLLDSLQRLQRVDPGFDAERVLTANVRLPRGETYAEAPAQVAFWQRALPELRAIPGVQGAALMGALPPNCGCYNNFDIVGRPAPDGNQPQSPWVPIDGGGFAALGVPLLEGRTFDSRDTPASPPVLVVSQSWAKRHFPNESAIGKELHEGGDTSRKLTIVGVVGDVKFDGLDQPGNVVFGPVEQGWGGDAVYVALRSAGDPLAAARPMQAVLQRLEPGIVPAEIATMPTVLRDSIGGQRHWAAVIAGLASAALLLAAIGVFAVLAYQVASQQREIGIRHALGASARSIVGMVVARGVRSALIGVAIGGAIAAYATKSLDGLLFGVGRADPVTWIAAALVLVVVAVAACWLPARRAAHVDPQVALRQD
jgi:putative ABC transport system permease protein